jgi:hypothetical protein
MLAEGQNNMQMSGEIIYDNLLGRCAFRQAGR